eukprot:10991692-Karenia_brevis.AAC.1
MLRLSPIRDRPNANALLSRISLAVPALSLDFPKMQAELKSAMLGTPHLDAVASRTRAPSNTSMCVMPTLEARHAATGTITDASIVDR